MSSYQSLIRDYLADAANSQTSLAADIGRSQAAVNRYANGLRFPDAQTARAMDHATQGRIPFAVWQEEMAARLGMEPRPTKDAA